MTERYKNTSEFLMNIKNTDLPNANVISTVLMVLDLLESKNDAGKTLGKIRDEFDRLEKVLSWDIMGSGNQTYLVSKNRGPVSDAKERAEQTMAELADRGITATSQLCGAMINVWEPGDKNITPRLLGYEGFERFPTDAYKWGNYTSIAVPEGATSEIYESPLVFRLINILSFAEKHKNYPLSFVRSAGCRYLYVGDLEVKEGANTLKRFQVFLNLGQPSFLLVERNDSKVVRSESVPVTHPVSLFQDTIAKFITLANNDPALTELKPDYYGVASRSPSITKVQTSIKNRS